MKKNIEEIYHVIRQYILENIKTNDWEIAILSIDIIEKSVGLKGSLISDNAESRFNTPGNFLLALDILELHSITTEGGHNRWNKLKFKLYPTGKFETDFIWDQEYQDKVDNVK